MIKDHQEIAEQLRARDQQVTKGNQKTVGARLLFVKLVAGIDERVYVASPAHV
jgi:hypothetical protein